MSRTRLLRVAAAILGTVAAVWMLQSSPADNAVSATYSSGVLHVVIPYHLSHAGAGELTVELLNPEDEAVASVQQRVNAAGDGIWREDLKPATALSREDLVWHRLRYR